MCSKLVVFVLTVFFCCCRSEKATNYTAAVVELNPKSLGAGLNSTNAVLKQVIDIIHSTEIKDVDILVFPESILNDQATAILLPNSTLLCDDPSAHFVLRNISCAVRDVQKYVVVDLNIKVKCEVDDQPFCAHKDDSTNLYNMAMVFNRHGEMIAKYRKYHLFNEDGVQQTIQPDVITFRTDFNVTFGVFICFDLMFDEPAQTLVERGVKHIVYPTMWFSELPYLTAAQFQQSWSYANDVTLLAANMNLPQFQCSGSGIYAGRSGALKAFVSRTPTTKILIANVPIEKSSKNSCQSSATCPIEPETPANIQTLHHDSESCENNCSSVSGSFLEALRRMSDEELAPQTDFYQEDLSRYNVHFLDFSNSTSQKGSVCNEGVCCDIDIEVTDNGELEGKTSYAYAISVFNGHRYYKPIQNLFTAQDVCSVIACTEMNSTESCGKRIPAQKVHNRFTFNKLVLQTELPIKYMKVMPNTLNTNLLPMAASDFEYDISKVEGKDAYAVRLALKVPKPTLLTFAIYSRNYGKDLFSSGQSNSGTKIILLLCSIFSFIWMRHTNDN